MEFFLPLPTVTRIDRIGTQYIWRDILFFCVLVVLPSSFFAFIDYKIFYIPGLMDLQFICFWLTMPYLIISHKQMTKLFQIPGGSALVILCLFLSFSFIYSLWLGIPINEVITIFRKNSLYPISTLALLLYACTMDNDRIFRLIRWILWASFIQACLYIISNFTGIGLFASKVKDEPIFFRDTVIYQNLIALPFYLFLLLSLPFLNSVYLDRKFRSKTNHLFWGIALLTVIISIVRGMLVAYILTMLLMIMLGYMLNIGGQPISRFMKIGILILSFFALSIIIFPNHIEKFLEKWEAENISRYGVHTALETYNYVFRLNLIEKAYDSLIQHGNLLLGNGYIRMGQAGEYDLVLGGDTYVAPILYTEGLLGFFFRLLPIASILYINILTLKKEKRNDIKIYSVFTISIIIPQCIAWVQTIIYTHYTSIMFILYLFEIIKYNYRKKLIVSINGGMDVS